MPDIAQAMTGTDDPINGDVAALRCDRALADLRKGRWVLMEGPRGAALVAAVDVDGEAPPVDGARAVAISSEKAADLGFAAPEGPLVLTPPANGHGGPGLLAAAAVALVAGQRRGIAEDWDRAAAGPEVAAALELLRRNQRMPGRTGASGRSGRRGRRGRSRSPAVTRRHGRRPPRRSSARSIDGR